MIAPSQNPSWRKVDDDFTSKYIKKHFCLRNKIIKLCETGEPLMEVVLGKTKMAAWFASNCRAVSNRLDLVETLQKYIAVDVYGDCGKFM